MLTEGRRVEPDPPAQSVAEPSVNITFRSCQSNNNVGGGYEISVKYNSAVTYAAPRRPMGSLFDNCSVSKTGDDTFREDGSAASCYQGHGFEVGGAESGARGSITIRNALIEGTVGAGIMLINTAPAGSAIGNVSVSFENITLRDTATQKQCAIAGTYAYVHTQPCFERPRNSICSENVTTSPIMTNLVVEAGTEIVAHLLPATT